MTEQEDNRKPDFDTLLLKIADFVHDDTIITSKKNATAFSTAKWVLLDSLGCGMLGLQEKACEAFLGPIVSETVVPLGVRVPGTDYVLDPVKAAFDIGACIRWLDYNDTWLAAEWGHPSDNLGGILAVADFVSQRQKVEKKPQLTIKDVLRASIMAHEIQGVLALDNAFNRVGLDHVVLVKVATTAVVSKLLGATKEQTLNALSNAWVDGQSLRTYRHAPNTGARKSWAAGDATSRGVRLAMMAMQGGMGYPSVLTAPMWGFQDVSMNGNPVTLARDLGSYVMENVLFKVSYPAEFHGQTAVECAIQLHDVIKNKMDDIDKIELITQEPAMRIINKGGPLHNYADRDHSLQYMVAIGLLFGELKGEHYSDETAKDPKIDQLRELMKVREDRVYSHDYLEPSKRAIPNSIQVFFKDGTSTDKVTVYYPLGHKLRREESAPFLKEKYISAINKRFEGKQADKLAGYWDLQEEDFWGMPVDDFMAGW